MMQVEPIISARLKNFVKSNELDSLNESEAFERFVNHTILSSHQPDAFGADPELLDAICVGGMNDMGIDGIGIKLNGLFVSETHQVDDIVERFPRVSFELIFIQSKMANKFDLGDFNKFTAGVRDFLSHTHRQPRNPKLDHMLSIREHLFSHDVMSRCEQSPVVRTYYVAMGKWRDSAHVNAMAQQFLDDVNQLQCYAPCDVRFVDADVLKNICDNNENTFSETINTIETMPLTDVNGVDNSCIVLCYASEYLRVLTTQDGMIRKSLFEDNVRDFQGDNVVNTEIQETLRTEPSRFGLLNNGVTIVCDAFTPHNRKMMIKNPRVVNGCQTSHVLFQAHQDGVDLSKVPLQVKVISTQDLEITNQIVRGTNRQTIVLDEAFEATKRFHRILEELCDALAPRYGRIYYERRSKQYQHDPRIGSTEKVNLRILTQSFVGMFLNAPHLAHRHESRLLRDFEGRIFQDEQSKQPYFAAALTFIKMERLFRRGSLDRNSHHSFRSHIAMVFRQLSVERLCPSIGDEKAIDKYCEELLAVVSDESVFMNNVLRATSLFESARRKWVDVLGRSRDGMKDVPEFTDLLLAECGSESNRETEKGIGRVTRVGVDRYGRYFGFIWRPRERLFFHTAQNEGLSFTDLEGKRVSYRVGKGSDGREFGADVCMLKDEAQAE